VEKLSTPEKEQRNNEVMSAEKLEQVSAEEKLKLLQQVRAKREKLRNRLTEMTESARKSPVARVLTDEVEEDKLPSTSMVIKLEVPPPHVPQPPPRRAEPSFAELVLSNLNALSPTELQALTEMNTKTNKRLVKPIKVAEVQRQGPKPESPNAKTLSKFAQLSRQDMGSDDNNNEQIASGKLKWRPADTLVTILSPEMNETRGSDAAPAKPILKTISTSSRDQNWEAEVSKSPVIIQRFVYQDNPRRITMSSKRAPPAKSTPTPPARTASSVSQVTKRARLITSTRK
jgi:hypothetical protein